MDELSGNLIANYRLFKILAVKMAIQYTVASTRILQKKSKSWFWFEIPVTIISLCTSDPPTQVK